MQSTLDRNGFKFVPDAKNDGDVEKEGSIEYLRRYYKNNKVKRGGYGQPLPGKIEGGRDKQVLFERRWIETLEPPTSVSLLSHVASLPCGASSCSRIFCQCER